VKKGWLGFREVNHVVYDPDQISLQKMETLLRKSGTYVETVSESKE